MKKCPQNLVIIQRKCLILQRESIKMCYEQKGIYPVSEPAQLLYDQRTGDEQE